jgi:hypothetical protein
VAQGQTATYTFNASCGNAPAWTVNPGGMHTIISQAGNSITIRWDVAGTRYLAAQASGCSPGAWIQSANLTVNVAGPTFYTQDLRDCSEICISNLLSTCYEWTVTYANGSVQTFQTNLNCGPASCASNRITRVCVRACNSTVSYCQNF